MPKYLYVNHSQFIQGLPATDLDSGQLTDAQRDTLQTAIEMGIYKLDTGLDTRTSVAAPVIERINDITDMVVNRGKSREKDGAEKAPKDEKKHEDTP